jgi:hypothetical protein
MNTWASGAVSIYIALTVAVYCEVEVTLRLTVSQPVCQGIEPALGLVTRYYFLSEGCCLKFAVLYLWGALSDERTGPSRSEHVTILYCLSWNSPNLEGQYISQQHGGPAIPPDTGLRKLYETHKYTVWALQLVPYRKHITSPLQSPTG